MYANDPLPLHGLTHKIAPKNQLVIFVTRSMTQAVEVAFSPATIETERLQTKQVFCDYIAWYLGHMT